MVYVGVILIALGAAYAISSMVVGHYVAKEEAQYSITAPNSKKPSIRLMPTKTGVIAGVVTFGVVLVAMQSLPIAFIFGVAIAIALTLSKDQARAKIAQLQAVIVYAQTVFPLLTSSMSNTVVAERASVALPPPMRAVMTESIQQANTRNLSMREAMLMFASKMQNQEIDVVMSVVASSFSASSEGFKRSSGDVVVKIFQQSLEQIASTVRSRQGVMTAGKMVTFGAPALLVFMNVLFKGGFTPIASDEILAAVVIAIMVVGSAAGSAMLSRPLSNKRLIEDTVLEQQIRAKTQIVEDLA